MSAVGIGGAGPDSVSTWEPQPAAEHRDRAAVAPTPRHQRLRGRPAGLLGLAFACYLALSVVLWWHVWSTHPTTVTTCGCDDPSLFTWFLEWPAYALAHGHNPFYSTSLFHPEGINLLSNTGVVAIGIPLAPVTWIFGPIATLNVASTLGPALTALSMCWLLSRWVRWAPAAFVGGLVFGFSPFVVTNLAGAHLMSAVLVLLPLMVACLDDLFVRQRHRPLVTGGVLGVLVTLQFFVGTEVLTMSAICAAAGVILLVAYGVIGHRQELARRIPHALRGTATAVATSAVLLAYPAWFALAGPAHLSGLVWPTIKPGAAGITLNGLWRLGYTTALRRTMLRIGGYLGPPLPHTDYLGPGILVVLAAGVLVWRRDRRLWFFGALGVIAAVLSLGVQHYWTPWRVLAHVPLVQNVISGRFMALVTLSAAVMLGIVVGRAHDWAASRRGDRVAGHRTRVLDRAAGRRGKALGLVAGLGVSALAVAPIATAVAGNIPFTTTSVVLPAWFSRAAPHLPPGQVVLTYPVPFALEQSAEDWQAVDGMTFAMAGGSGPESIVARAGKERAGQEVLGAASFSVDGPPQPSAANLDAVREALAGWRVTLFVMPDPTVAPVYEQGTNPAAALGLFTLAVGREPVFVDNAWVWSRVRALGPSRSISAAAFAGCTAPARLHEPSNLAVPRCVMAASRPTS